MAQIQQADGGVFSTNASQAGLVWHRFRRHRLALVGLVIIGLVVLSSIVVPLLSPFRSDEIDGNLYLQPVGARNAHDGRIHLLGTDGNGRDFLTLLFVGGRATLLVAVVPTLAIVVIGALVGAVAGYFGGWIDTLIMRVTDFVSALPLLPAYLFAFRIIRPSPVTDLRPQDVPNIVMTLWLVLILFGWMGICRLVRGQLLSMRQAQYVEASRALGAGHARIIFKHLLPNAAAPVIVAATFALGEFIILEAVLNYFGLGLRVPTVWSWGNLITLAQGYAWNLSDINPFQDIKATLLLLPTLFVFVTVLSINFIGDGLRDALDPHSA